VRHLGENPDLLDNELKALLKFWNPLFNSSEIKGG
jgi:hypothetical protein